MLKQSSQQFAIQQGNCFVPVLPSRASLGRRASGCGGCGCWFPGGPLPEQAQLHKQPGEHVHQQRQSQGGAQF